MKNNLINDCVDIYTQTEILRDKQTKNISFKIAIDTDWKLYAEKEINLLNASNNLVASGDKKGTYPINSNNSERIYFKLETKKGSTILAEKHLPMNGGYNFRDLGGIKNKEGKYVKWGKIFRTDDLGNLSDDDLTYLDSIPITSVIDLRNNEEKDFHPDKLPDTVKNYIHLNIDPGSLRDLVKSDLESKEQVIEAMKALYKLFITNDKYTNSYKTFFKYVQNEDDLPLIFHCAAGKDRTGFGAAMLLLALDVPIESIMEDYLASNYYLEDKYKHLFVKNPVNKYLYTIAPEYLETSFAEIINKYESYDNFIINRLGINKEKLKEKLLFENK